MKAKKLPAIERLRELFTYSDGALFRRKTSSSAIIGTRAGSKRRLGGYRRICVDGQVYTEHLVIWAICHGCYATERVDHIDRDSLNNRIENLRLATESQNNANRRGSRKGPKGVTFHRGAGKWQAQIGASGRMFYLGLFPTEVEAAIAYDKAALSKFGKFALTNAEARP